MMKVAMNTVKLTLAIVLFCFFLYGCFCLAKTVSYKLFYEDMVRGTIIETVKPEALNINFYEINDGDLARLRIRDGGYYYYKYFADIGAWVAGDNVPEEYPKYIYPDDMQTVAGFEFDDRR